MKLEDFKERRPFGTPEGYFARLNREIIASTSKAPAAVPVQKRAPIALWAKVLGNAAMLALVALVAYHALEETGSMPVAENYEQEIDNEMIDNILNSCRIDDYTFYSYLTDTAIE